MKLLILALALMGQLSDEIKQYEGNHPYCQRLEEHLGPFQWNGLEEDNKPGEPSIVYVCNTVIEETHRQNAYDVVSRSIRVASGSQERPLSLLEPSLAVAVTYCESGLRWDPSGNSYYVGPMQVGRKWCTYQGAKDFDNGCIRAGVYWLKVWHKKTGSWREALKAYVGAYKKGLSPTQKRRKAAYLGKVLRYQKVMQD
jgi:hypothetical protein